MNETREKLLIKIAWLLPRSFVYWLLKVDGVYYFNKFGYEPERFRRMSPALKNYYRVSSPWAESIWKIEHKLFGGYAWPMYGDNRPIRMWLRKKGFNA